MRDALQLAFAIVATMMFVIATAQILAKAGFSRWWCVLAFFPLINLLMLCVFAYAKWPALERPPRA